MKVCRSPGASAALLLSQSPGAGSAPEAVPVQGVETCPRPTAHGAQGRRALAVLRCAASAGPSAFRVRTRAGCTISSSDPSQGGSWGRMAVWSLSWIVWRPPASASGRPEKAEPFVPFFRPSCTRGGARRRARGAPRCRAAGAPSLRAVQCPARTMPQAHMLPRAALTQFLCDANLRFSEGSLQTAHARACRP